MAKPSTPSGDPNSITESTPSRKSRPKTLVVKNHLAPSRIFWLRQQSKHVAEVSWSADLLEDAGTDEFGLQRSARASGRASARATSSVSLGLDPERSRRSLIGRPRSSASFTIWGQISSGRRICGSSTRTSATSWSKRPNPNWQRIFSTRGLSSALRFPSRTGWRLPVPSKRLGPSFTRPGSIPSPKDRLLYQVLADDLVSPDRAGDRPVTVF